MLATANPGKVAEIAAILGDRFALESRPGSVPEVVEDADTLLGNARRTPALSGVYDGALEAVRRNPVPVLLIAAGVGLLFNRMARDSERRRTQVSAERVATLNTGAARGYDPDLPTARPARDPLEKTDI